VRPDDEEAHALAAQDDVARVFSGKAREEAFSRSHWIKPTDAL
jgi:hypothetical protein